MKHLITYSLVFIMFCPLGCEKELALNPNDNYDQPKWKQLVNDTTIYDLLNSCIVADSTYKYSNTVVGSLGMLYLNESDSLNILKADTIFSKKDAAFIFKQARLRHFFNIDKSKLQQDKNVIYLDEKEVFGERRSEYFSTIRQNHGSLYMMTMPVFSTDLKTAMISTSNNCGTLCGVGATYIYKKINGQWKLVAIWNKWIS